MARLKISTQFRKQLSEKLMDLGNLIAAALVFGQFISNKEFSIILLVIGIIGMSLCYLASFLISK